MLVQIVITSSTISAIAVGTLPGYFTPFNGKKTHVTLHSIDYLGSANANKLVELNAPFRDFGGQFIQFISKMDGTQNSFSATNMNKDLGIINLPNPCVITPMVAGSVADCVYCVLSFDIKVLN